MMKLFPSYIFQKLMRAYGFIVYLCTTFLKHYMLHCFMKAHIRDMENKYIEDVVFGERLKISMSADPKELNSNIRAARAILSSFPEVSIVINPHRLIFGHKNPEYLICNQLGDRKGIVGEKGVTAGFKSAKKQGCKIVVIDLDEHILQVHSFELSKYISRRKADFVNELITDCYVVFDGQAVRVNARYQTRREIESIIEMLRP